MRNAVGAPRQIGSQTWRASTCYTFGGSTYQSVVQPFVGPGDRWGIGTTCRHAHRSSATALDCGYVRLNRKSAAYRTEPGDAALESPREER